MTAPESLKIAINELLDKHWEELLRDEMVIDVIYNDEYYFPIKVQFVKEGKYYVIRMIAKPNMITEL